MNYREHRAAFFRSIQDADDLWRSVCKLRPAYDLSIFTVCPISGGYCLYACTTLYRQRWEGATT